MLAVFLVGGGADAAQLAVLQRRLEQVRGVHSAAAGRPGADHGMNFINEHDRALKRLDLLHHRLDALFKITPIAGSGQKRPHIKLIDGAFMQHFRHLFFDNPQRKPFGNRRFAYPGIADKKRVVFLPPAQDLYGAADFLFAPDQRVDLAGERLDIQIDTIIIKHRVARLSLTCRRANGIVLFLFGLIRAPDRAGLGHIRPLGNAVADVIDRVIAGHFLLLQEKYRMAFTLGEYGNQNIRPGHFLAARGLHMQNRPLDHALETRRRLGLLDPRNDQGIKLGLDIFKQVFSEQFQIDIARPQNRGCIRVILQDKQKMLKGRIFMAVLNRQPKGFVQSVFQVLRKCRHILCPCRG